LLVLTWTFTLGPGNLFLPVHPGFRSTSAGNVTMHYQVQSSDLVNEVLECFRSADRECRQFWGDPPAGADATTVFLCDSPGRYLQLSGGTPGNGCAFGSWILMCPAGVVTKPNLRAAIYHETSHAYLRKHVGYWRALRVPVWLDEGIATYLGEPTWASRTALRKQLEAMPTPEVVSADSLTSKLQWSDALLRGQVAVCRQYGATRSFVDYLVAEHGRRNLKTFVHATLREGGDGAFATVYGAQLTRVEQDWLTHEASLGRVPQGTRLVRRGPGAATRAAYYLTCLLVVVGILWVIRQFFIVTRLVIALIRPGRRQVVE